MYFKEMKYYTRNTIQMAAAVAVTLINVLAKEICEFISKNVDIFPIAANA